MWVPDAKSYVEDAAKHQAKHRLTLTAAALKLHQLQNGAYPESLAALTPDPLDALPVDPFSGKAFRYERRDKGFVLWSVGPNEWDDGANDQLGDFNDGDHAPIDWLGERDPRPNADDIVVRFPIPPLVIPESAPTPTAIGH